jgi:glycogen phosphorylase
MKTCGGLNSVIALNGALTVGTRDGATVEMAEAAGEENVFLFGLSAEPVAQSRGYYCSQWHYDNEPVTRAALDLIAGNHFSPHEPGVFTRILDTLPGQGDHYLHVADLKSYREAHARLGGLYADKEGWLRKAILNIASSGMFSSDRTIAEYAKEICPVEACPVE